MIPLFMDVGAEQTFPSAIGVKRVSLLRLAI
jgi:hypothetical protein